MESHKRGGIRADLRIGDLERASVDTREVDESERVGNGFVPVRNR